jgi:DNA polymerase-3 subunit epsilon
VILPKFFMREIVLDTETTGLDPSQGHRIVELGCIELLNGIPTGSTFHTYINPERDVPPEAFAVHGLSAEFLKEHKRFIDIADQFLAFVGDAPLVIHNAAFDHAFLCAELKRADRAVIPRERLVDTLLLARRKHPAGPNRLDDLCARYGIDNSRRTKHGALLDAEILAEVYVELIGARQAQLSLAESDARRTNGSESFIIIRERPEPLAPRLSEADIAAHREFVIGLGERALWLNYVRQKQAPVEPAPFSDGTG